jgi:AraC-like DNA-binding protein
MEPRFVVMLARDHRAESFPVVGAHLPAYAPPRRFSQTALVNSAAAPLHDPLRASIQGDQGLAAPSLALAAPDGARQVTAQGQHMLLAEIAQSCGFASQSHMTDVFRRQGVATPATWRSNPIAND